MNGGRQVAKAALIVLVMNVLSRVLGFGRDAVIASAFGATRATDAYMVAYTLPYSLQAVLGMAFATVMVPVVSGFLARGEDEEAWGVTSTILSVTVLLLSVLTILGLLWAPLLVRLMAPGFPAEVSGLATGLTRIMFPSLLFMGVGMLLTGILNAGGRFALPAFAPALANIVVILAVLLLGRRYWVAALAWGTLVGFMAFLAVQLPGLKMLGFRYKASLGLLHPAVLGAGTALFPVLLAVSVNQVYLALNRFFASQLPGGLLTSLDLANRVMNLPLGIFAAAVITALFPSIASQAARGERAALAQGVRRGLDAVLLLSLPSAVALMVLREPLIRLLFQHGAFQAEATLLTASALLFFAPGLLPQALNMVLQRAFYSLGDVRTPMWLGAASILADALFSLALLPTLGYTGLALANTLAAALNSAALLVCLRSALPELKLSPFFSSGLRQVVASLAAGLLLAYAWRFIQGTVAVAGLPGLIGALALSLALLALVYGILLLLLRVEEVNLLAGLAGRRRRRCR